MHVYLLSILFVLSSSLPKIPNFYPNLIAAKAASKNYNKDLLVFFSKSSCASCDQAWENFENDPIASKIYISTSVSIQDFDGAVFLDKYGLKNAPAWVVLDPQGQVKDKWEGEWKKTPTRPANPEQKTTTKPVVENEVVSISQTAPKTINLETSIAVTTPAAVIETSIQAKENVTATTPMAQEKATEVQVSKVIETDKPVFKENTTTIATAPSIASVETSGFVLQAGYFGSEVNATKLVADLDSKGFKGFSIKPSVSNGTTYHRVISTVFNSEKEAHSAIENLQKAGIKATIKTQKEL